MGSATLGASLMAQMVKNLPVMQETLGWEDPLEKGMGNDSSILAWRIPWTEEPGRLQSNTCPPLRSHMSPPSPTGLRDK